MTHFNPTWHAEYLTLENAEAVARAAYRSARNPAEKTAALEVLRATGKARFDFEMAATHVVDIATLAPAEWAKALRSA